MNTKLKQKYIGIAKDIYEKEGEIEIDDNAQISAADETHGAYVQAWVWVYREQLTKRGAELC